MTLVGVVLAAACLLSASVASADIEPRPAPPPTKELPSQSPEGLTERYGAYYRAFVAQDTATLWLFYNATLREAFDPVAYGRFLAITPFTLQREEVFFMPFPRDGAPQRATLMATLAIGGAGPLYLCHVTEWRWGQPFHHEGANWYIAFEVMMTKFVPCWDQFKLKPEPRT
ncbi:MAG: hypothetical protein Q8R35_00920 [bacterium]|nr:hypothetical protein [bacterium]